MSKEGKANEKYTSNNLNFPGDEEFRVAPLSLPANRSTSRPKSPVLGQQDGQLQELPLISPSRISYSTLPLIPLEDDELRVAPLLLSSASRATPIPDFIELACQDNQTSLLTRRYSGPTAIPQDEELQVAPLSLRKRRSTPDSLALLTLQGDFKITPLTIKKVAHPTTAKALSILQSPHTPKKDKSSPPFYLSKNQSFEPETPPPPTLSFGSEESSPKVINRRPKTGPLVTVTPPTESSPQSSFWISTPTFASRVPPEDLFETPGLLHVPHSSGKASDLRFRNYFIVPVIGRSPQVVDNRLKIMSGEGKKTMKPPALKVADGASSSEATATPPNTSVEPKGPEYQMAIEAEILGVAGLAGDEGPIIEDLTPSHGTSGILTGTSSRSGENAEISSGQPANTPSANTAGDFPPTIPTTQPHQSLQVDSAGASESEGVVSSDNSSPESSRRPRGTKYLERKARQEREAAEEAIKNEASGLSLRKLPSIRFILWRVVGMLIAL